MGRILIADDHDSLRRGLARAVADAGHDVEEAPNGNAAIEKLHEGFFDVVVSDLRDGRQHRSRGAQDGQDASPLVGHHPHDGVRLGIDGGRSDEVRRLRLRAEAVRNRGDGGQDREGARDAPDAEPDRLPPARPGRHLRFRSNHRLERRARKSARRRAQGRQEQHDRARARRDRHGQGAHRGRRSPQFAASGAELRQGELRRAAGEPARVRAVRAREGRVHGRRQAADRPLRTGRRRHAVPRRNRRHEPQHAGQDPARAPGARVRAAGRHPHASRWTSA